MKKGTKKTVSWLTTFFTLAGGVTRVEEIDFVRHRKIIEQAVQDANPKGFAMLSSLIDITLDEASRVGEFSFRHIEGDKNCLCSLCQGKEGEILLKMYYEHGIRIVLKEDQIDIVIV